MLTGRHQIGVVPDKSTVDDAGVWKRHWMKVSGLPFHGSKCQIEGCDKSARLCPFAIVIGTSTESTYILPIPIFIYVDAPRTLPSWFVCLARWLTRSHLQMWLSPQQKPPPAPGIVFSFHHPPTKLFRWLSFPNSSYQPTHTTTTTYYKEVEPQMSRRVAQWRTLPIQGSSRKQKVL